MSAASSLPFQTLYGVKMERMEILEEKKLRRKSSSPGKYRFVLKREEEKGRSSDRRKEEKEDRKKEKGKERDRGEKDDHPKGKEREREEKSPRKEKRVVPTIKRVASGENRLRFDMVPRTTSRNGLAENPLTAREKFFAPNNEGPERPLVRSKSLYLSSQEPQPKAHHPPPPRNRKSLGRSPSRKSPFKDKSGGGGGQYSPDPTSNRRVNPRYEDVFSPDHDRGKSPRKKSTIARSTSFGSKSSNAISKQSKHTQVSSPKFCRKTRDVAILLQNDLGDLIDTCTLDGMANYIEKRASHLPSHDSSPPHGDHNSTTEGSPDGSPNPLFKPHRSPEGPSTSFVGSGPMASPTPLSNSFEATGQKRKRTIRSMLKTKESKNVDIVRNFIGPGSKAFADVAQRIVINAEDEDNFSLDTFQDLQTELEPALFESDDQSCLEGFEEMERTIELVRPLPSSPSKLLSFSKQDKDKSSPEYAVTGLLEGPPSAPHLGCEHQLPVGGRGRRSQKKKGSRFLQRASVISNFLQNRPTKDELEEKTSIFPDHKKKQDTMAMLTEFLDHSLSSYSCNTTESEFDDTQSDQSQIGLWSSGMSSEKCGLTRSMSTLSNLSLESFPTETTPRDPFTTPRDGQVPFWAARRDSNSTYSSGSSSSSVSSARLASSLNSSRKHSFSEEFFKAVDGRTIEYQSIQIERPVGRGKFGTVFKGNWKGKEVAVKRLQLSSFAQTEKTFLREVSALRKAEECRSIVNLVGVCCCPCALVMELWEGGSLYDMIHIRQQKTSLNETLRVLLDVAEALRFLHYSLSPSVIHRDVTTRNILLRKKDERLEACLADFGIATTTKKKGAQMSPIGRLRYMAPEVTDKVYTKKADQFMFGNVIYEIVVRKKPFCDLTAEEAARRRKRGEIPEIPDSCPKRFAELMRDCWEFKPKDRPNMKEICRRLASI